MDPKEILGLDIPVTSTYLQKNQVLFAMYVCKFSPPSSIGSVFVCDWTVYLERKSVPLMMWRISPWFLGLITPASGHSSLDFFPFWICTILMFVSKKQLLGESWSGQMIMFHQPRFPWGCQFDRILMFHPSLLPLFKVQGTMSSGSFPW